MKIKITRRTLAHAMLAPIAVAQTPQAAPATAQDELQAARERLKTAGAALAGQHVDISTEPATQFKA